MNFQKALPLFSITLLALAAWTASNSDHGIPKEKSCKDSISYTVDQTEITYRLVGDFCFLGTMYEAADRKHEYRYSMGSTGLFYAWDNNFAHAIAFLPTVSKPFPHPLPTEGKTEYFYLHLPNGENVIFNTKTGKVDWENSFKLGLTSAHIMESKPNEKGHMINISGYAKDQMLIDFGSSAAGDPFINRKGKGKIYKFLENEIGPRTCIVSNVLFWAEGYEADFSQARIDKALKECAKQPTWISAPKKTTKKVAAL